jgi:hypothetical protein
MKKFKFSPQSQQTFNRFFANVTDILHTAFTLATVKLGLHDERCILVSHLDWLTAAQLGRRMAGRGLDHSKYAVVLLLTL